MSQHDLQWDGPWKIYFLGNSQRRPFFFYKKKKLSHHIKNVHGTKLGTWTTALNVKRAWEQLVVNVISLRIRGKRSSLISLAIGHPISSRVYTGQQWRRGFVRGIGPDCFTWAPSVGEIDLLTRMLSCLSHKCFLCYFCCTVLFQSIQIPHFSCAVVRFWVTHRFLSEHLNNKSKSLSQLYGIHKNGVSL